MAETPPTLGPPAPPQPWADLPKVVELAKRKNAVIKITGACTLSKEPYPYVEIYGTNFSTVSRLWAGADFSGANAPTSLEGVSVRINGKLAYIYYVSPGQINVNVPEDTTTGPVTIRVTTSVGSSNEITVTRSRLSRRC